VAGGNTIVLDQWPCSFRRNACGGAAFQQKYEISNRGEKKTNYERLKATCSEKHFELGNMQNGCSNIKFLDIIRRLVFI
jgi:hypothetical protein